MTRRVHGWRRLAGVTWSAPRDPQFFGDLDVDAAHLLAYIDEVRRRTGVHLTVTHLAGKAVAHGLAAVPALQVRINHGREHDRESVDVFFIVSAGDELTGVKISDADTKPVVEIGRELDARVGSIRAGEDPQLGRTKQLLERTPRPLLRAAIRLSAWLTSDLNLDLPRLGLPRQAFGGAMITSVGGWGIRHAYSPLASYYRVPLLVLVGAVEQRPVAVSGRVVIRPMLGLTATFDHRWSDGLQAAAFARAAQEYLADPAAFEPPLGVGTVDLTEAPIPSIV